MQIFIAQQHPGFWIRCLFFQGFLKSTLLKKVANMFWTSWWSEQKSSNLSTRSHPEAKADSPRCVHWHLCFGIVILRLPTCKRLGVKWFFTWGTKGHGEQQKKGNRKTNNKHPSFQAKETFQDTHTHPKQHVWKYKISREIDENVYSSLKLVPDMHFKQMFRPTFIQLSFIHILQLGILLPPLIFTRFL